MEWQPIETAPKDGTRIEFMNVNNGLTDAGHWEDYSNVPQSHRAMWPQWLIGEDGEWFTDAGNGEMTHWRKVEGRDEQDRR